MRSATFSFVGLQSHYSWRNQRPERVPLVTLRSVPQIRSASPIPAPPAAPAKRRLWGTTRAQRLGAVGRLRQRQRAGEQSSRTAGANSWTGGAGTGEALGGRGEQAAAGRSSSPGGGCSRRAAAGRQGQAAGRGGQWRDDTRTGGGTHDSRGRGRRHQPGPISNQPEPPCHVLTHRSRIHSAELRRARGTLSDDAP